MTFHDCLPLDTLGLQFSYCPSMGASIFFFALFSLSMFAHICQSVYYRAGYASILVFGALFQALSFLGRCVSIAYPTNEGMYKTGYLLGVLAPCGVYVFFVVVVAKLIGMFMPSNRILQMKGEALVAGFVSVTIIAFALQWFGSDKAIDKISKSDEQRGREMYLAGAVLQLFLDLVLIILTIIFLRNLSVSSTKSNTRRARVLGIMLLSALSLIKIRHVYTIILFSGKPDNPVTTQLSTHEAWFYCFDALPLFLVISFFHFYHPGRVLHGSDSTFTCCDGIRKKGERICRLGRKRNAESEFVYVTRI